MNMKTVIGLALLITFAPGLAFGATPAPAPSPSAVHAHSVMYHKTPTKLTNPGARGSGQPILTGAGCNGPRANAAQAATNPITGQPQAAPIVQIPVNGGGVPSATNRAQQNQACIHPH